MYETAFAYAETGYLEAFLTSRFATNGFRRKITASVLPPNLREKMLRYSDSRIERYTHVFTSSRIRQLMLMALSNRHVSFQRDDFIERIGRFCIAGALALHTHPTGALEAFRQLKREGLPCILEQYVADYRWSAEVLREECARLGLDDVNQELRAAGYTSCLIDRFEEEKALTDVFMCPSDFVSLSLMSSGIPRDKIKLARYGIAPEHIAKSSTSRDKNEPLKIAFVGTGALRKGFHHLLDAILALKSIPLELHVYGQRNYPQWMLPRLSKLRERITFHGFMPKASLVESLGRCHVGALPSLIEGSAIAVMDYLSQGLPCVVTANTGSCISDRVEGFVVDPSDATAIAMRLREMLNEETRKRMADAALALAHSRTWAAYRRETMMGYLSIADGAQAPRRPD
jgi:glycosyltransferase involved in cell wall biosynthesis